MSDGLIRVAFSGLLGSFRLDAAFDAPAQGVTGLFGPSGCGKTSVLRAIAGLNHFPGGLCIVDGAPWQDGAICLPPHRRPVGYVFQEASLFPHLSVKGNLLFGAGKNPDAAMLAHIVALLGLEKLLNRAPHFLSGGERQRVAIGRALMSRPALLLMDEPLAALDRAAKNDIMPFLQHLAASVGVPMIYISHDMREIERLADHLVLMDKGRVIGSGALAALQADAALPLAAERDATITLDALVTESDCGDGLMALSVDGQRLMVPRAGISAGSKLRLHVAAADVSLAAALPVASTILNSMRATIIAARPVSESEMLVVLALGAGGTGQRLLARITQRSWRLMAFSPGAAIHAQIKGASLAPRTP